MERRGEKAREVSGESEDPKKASSAQRLVGASLLRLLESGMDAADDARADDKKIEDFKLQGGSVIHLVLALRGGR